MKLLLEDVAGKLIIKREEEPGVKPADRFFSYEVTAEDSALMEDQRYSDEMRIAIVPVLQVVENRNALTKLALLLQDNPQLKASIVNHFNELPTEKYHRRQTTDDGFKLTPVYLKTFFLYDIITDFFENAHNFGPNQDKQDQINCLCYLVNDFFTAIEETPKDQLKQEDVVKVKLKQIASRQSEKFFDNPKEKIKTLSTEVGDPNELPMFKEKPQLQMKFVD